MSPGSGKQRQQDQDHGRAHGHEHDEHQHQHQHQRHHHHYHHVPKVVTVERIIIVALLLFRVFYDGFVPPTYAVDYHNKSSNGTTGSVVETVGLEDGDDCSDNGGSSSNVNSRISSSSSSSSGLATTSDPIELEEGELDDGNDNHIKTALLRQGEPGSSSSPGTIHTGADVDTTTAEKEEGGGAWYRNSVVQFPIFDKSKAIISSRIEDHEIYERQVEMMASSRGNLERPGPVRLGERLPCPVPLPTDTDLTANHTTNHQFFDYHSSLNSSSSSSSNKNEHNNLRGSSTSDTAAASTSYQQVPSSQITVIFTGSARYCHPKLNLINAVWDTHVKYLKGFEHMPVIFALDGYGDVGYNQVKARKAKAAAAQNISLEGSNYEQFKYDLQNKYPNSQFLILNDNVGQRELVQRAIMKVTTPIVYVAQDDFGLRKPIDGDSVAVTMMNAALGYNNVRYILLAKNYRGGQKRHYSFYGPNQESALAPNVPLPQHDMEKVYPYLHLPKEDGDGGNATSTTTANSVITSPTNYNGDNNMSLSSLVLDPGSVCLPHFSRRIGFYSDNNHFALTELYSKYLIPKASSAKFLEDIHTVPALKTPELWGRYYGTHQYANYQMLDHLDGRDLQWCDDEKTGNWTVPDEEPAKYNE
mmetsp:Transcript_31283/g.75662  ORF Transcript_31283/g.75662 Transcript_31283/m.75662 type:complete len:643 (-) Transcript_31283:187-2115(-)|eukprot:CAMPEP_0113480674 /NCGR_PEP_ID=MMETSP0014_2-20120614/22002_1 /TAXON_ID=2857 /ORGANISM="Nitzschia sp." /LENGTH=642 /DNA_ID=CAMNT_0000374121 /DNA_START=18 /DNA_END=1946 /DNA_ORIENTATION=+ /assembly_acc=CAM_ASM_000159